MSFEFPLHLTNQQLAALDNDLTNTVTTLDPHAQNASDRVRFNRMGLETPYGRDEARTATIDKNGCRSSKKSPCF